MRETRMNSNMSVYWEGDEDAEDIRRYNTGGLHPISLGDVLTSPNSDSPLWHYRILHKLGHGAFSTVWLAEVLHEQSRRYVALKIYQADVDPSHELNIFKRLQETKTRNVLELLDSFSLPGPNGVHTVLVHNVLGSLYNFVFSKSGHKYTRMLCRQIACGLAALHRQGIVHGDLHPGNVGIVLTTLDKHPFINILDYFNCPEITPILPTTHPAHPERLPSYLVPSISIVDYIINKDPEFLKNTESLSAEIMDLSSAVLIDEQSQPLPHCTAATVCAPELMFERVSRSVRAPSTRASDIWSLACTIYELAFGHSLFHRAAPDDSLLGEMANKCGKVPHEWKIYWESREQLRDMSISQETTDAGWQRRLEGIMNGPKSFSEVDIAELFTLLRSMLKMDPESRITAEEVLRHPWFARED